MIYIIGYLVIITILVIIQQIRINSLHKAIKTRENDLKDFTEKQHKLNKESLKAIQHILDEHNYMKQSDATLN